MTSHCYSSPVTTELLSETDGKDRKSVISTCKKNSGQNYLSWVKVKRVRKKKSLQRTKQKKVEIKIRLRVKMTERPDAVSSENKSSPFIVGSLRISYFLCGSEFIRTQQPPQKIKSPFQSIWPLCPNQQCTLRSEGKVPVKSIPTSSFYSQWKRAPITHSLPSVQSNTSILTSCYLPDK